MHRFVDVEGQGAEDGTYDTLLALPLLLTSKVYVHWRSGCMRANMGGDERIECTYVCMYACVCVIYVCMHAYMRGDERRGAMWEEDW